ncbi:hypothetical protein E4U13_004200 [Claviceps humidiphila]|uniref:Uncharacterized protein n=1 Tax=Claviceps humidiphila TaxID=1294629 RepID=A0A9P7PZW1_9HYPO|nr:hypothetical protein E4U13_004200 [Claviceps humidiphila]
MIGRLTFHHVVSLEDTENIKTKVNPYPQSSLSLSLTHTHTHTHLFSYRANTSHQTIFFSQISKMKLISVALPIFFAGIAVAHMLPIVEVHAMAVLP